MFSRKKQDVSTTPYGIDELRKLEMDYFVNFQAHDASPPDVPCSMSRFPLQGSRFDEATQRRVTVCPTHVEFKHLLDTFHSILIHVRGTSMDVDGSSCLKTCIGIGCLHGHNRSFLGFCALAIAYLQVRNQHMRAPTQTDVQYILGKWDEEHRHAKGHLVSVERFPLLAWIVGAFDERCSSRVLTDADTERVQKARLHSLRTCTRCSSVHDSSPNKFPFVLDFCSGHASQATRCLSDLFSSNQVHPFQDSYILCMDPCKTQIERAKEIYRDEQKRVMEFGTSRVFFACGNYDDLAVCMASACKAWNLAPHLFSGFDLVLIKNAIHYYANELGACLTELTSWCAQNCRMVLQFPNAQTLTALQYYAYDMVCLPSPATTRESSFLPQAIMFHPCSLEAGRNARVSTLASQANVTGAGTAPFAEPLLNSYLLELELVKLEWMPHVSSIHPVSRSVTNRGHGPWSTQGISSNLPIGAFRTNEHNSDTSWGGMYLTGSFVKQTPYVPRTMSLPVCGLRDACKNGPECYYCSIDNARRPEKKRRISRCEPCAREPREANLTAFKQVALLQAFFDHSAPDYSSVSREIPWEPLVSALNAYLPPWFRGAVCLSAYASSDGSWRFPFFGVMPVALLHTRVEFLVDKSVDRKFPVYMAQKDDGVRCLVLVDPRQSNALRIDRVGQVTSLNFVFPSASTDQRVRLFDGEWIEETRTLVLYEDLTFRREPSTFIERNEKPDWICEQTCRTLRWKRYRRVIPEHGSLGDTLALVGAYRAGTLHASDHLSGHAQDGCVFWRFGLYKQKSSREHTVDLYVDFPPDLPRNKRKSISLTERGVRLRSRTGALCGFLAESSCEEVDRQTLEGRVVEVSLQCRGTRVGGVFPLWNLKQVRTDKTGIQHANGRSAISDAISGTVHPIELSHLFLYLAQASVTPGLVHMYADSRTLVASIFTQDLLIRGSVPFPNIEDKPLSGPNSVHISGNVRVDFEQLVLHYMDRYSGRLLQTYSSETSKIFRALFEVLSSADLEVERLRKDAWSKIADHLYANFVPIHVPSSPYVDVDATFFANLMDELIQCADQYLSDKK